MSPCIISHFRSIFNSARSISPAIDIFLSLCTIRKIKIGIFDKQNRPLFAPFTPKLSKRVQGKSKKQAKTEATKAAAQDRKRGRETRTKDETRERRTRDEGRRTKDEGRRTRDVLSGARKYQRALWGCVLKIGPQTNRAIPRPIQLRVSVPNPFAEQHERKADPRTEAVLSAPESTKGRCGGAF